MAIKWKNNKKKEIKEKERKGKENLQEMQDVEAEVTVETLKTKKKTWLGYLLVAVLVLATSVFSYKLGPSLEEMKKNSEKEWEEQHGQDKLSSFNLDYRSDKEKMALVANIYYLNYKLENMYEGTSASQFLLQDSKEYKKLKTTDGLLKQEYEEKAEELMNVIYSCYRMDYTVNNWGTHTYFYDTKRGVSVGETELGGIISDDLEELENKYCAYMVIEYGEDGQGYVRNAHNIESEEFDNYINNIKLQAVADYFIKQENFSIYEAETTTNYTEIYDEEGYEEIYEEETYTEDVYEEETDVEVYDDEGTSVSVAVSEEAEPIEETGVSKAVKIEFPKIKNAQIVIALTPYDGYYAEEDYYYERISDIYELSYVIVIVICVIVLAFAAVLQNIRYLGLKEQRIFNIPTEIVAFLAFFGIGMTFAENLPYELLVQTRADLFDWIYEISGGYVGRAFIRKLPQIICILSWICYYGMVYLVGANFLPYVLHPIKNIRNKSIVIGILKWLKKQWKKLWNYVTTIDAEKSLQNNVLKLVIANFILVTLCCCIWVFGILGIIIYSVVLYFLLVKKGAQIQKHYQGLLQLTKNMANGDLNEETSEDLGIFDPFKAELSTIRKGFKQAVEKEVRSQNMKTELITNVSHDLKTPLTAIITYVDLLKNENLSEKTRKEYIDTLDKKSQRLKVLIEDLFEVSKASTNNITMHYADVDLVNLIKQVRLENEERIMDSDLNFRWNLPEEKCMLRLDPQKTYRIIENLVINALKYSMSGSRVYVDLLQEEKEIVITIKNISATELNFDPEEITERFVRGDLSRNTEGSGLGLAIVRSFTELQNGKFYIEIDGDLFKAIVVFYK